MWADIGLPLAYSVWQGLATANPEGKPLIEETWKVFCEMINIDPEARYEILNAAMASSPNDEVDEE